MVGSSNDGRGVMLLLSYQLFCCKYNYNIEFSKHLWCKFKIKVKPGSDITIIYELFAFCLIRN